jgi:hypothetical protein
MQTATAEKAPVGATTIASITRAIRGPVFVPTDRGALGVLAGTTFLIDGDSHLFDFATPVILPDLVAGTDYVIRLVDNVLQASPAENSVRDGSVWGADLDGVLGGFHFAPGGNATARAGGDELPAINPYSCWDIGYRPACEDPRGMACIDGRFWCDIYLLGCNPFVGGSSRFGVVIADGTDVPMDETDEQPYDSLDHPTAVKIFGMLGKQLLGPEEFFAATYGVTEGTSIGEDPKMTKLDVARTSKWGVMQATGNMSTWGNDGDPDGPRNAWRFGGSWGVGGFAGSRFARVDYWPGYSAGWVGARGRSDHLQLESPAR